LSMYKRIASAKSNDDIQELQVELIDRFGLLPDATKNLLHVQQIKLRAAHLGVKKIEASDRGGVIEFHEDAQIDPGFLVGLLQSRPDKYKFDGPTKIKFVESLTDRRERMNFIDELLTQFASHQLVA